MASEAGGSNSLSEGPTFGEKRKKKDKGRLNGGNSSYGQAPALARGAWRGVRGATRRINGKEICGTFKWGRRMM